MLCEKTNTEIGSSTWRREAVCDCKNCKEFFRMLRTREIEIKGLNKND